VKSRGLERALNHSGNSTAKRRGEGKLRGSRLSGENKEYEWRKGLKAGENFENHREHLGRGWQGSVKKKEAHKGGGPVKGVLVRVDHGMEEGAGWGLGGWGMMSVREVKK